MTSLFNSSLYLFMINHYNRYLFALLLLLVISCTKTYTPKPYGYFRIDLPKKEYAKITNELPYKFEIPSYAKLVDDKDVGAEKYWVNVQFPQFNATIHISYKALHGNIDQIIDDSHKMAYKHSVKADAIKETGLFMEEKRVFGLMYEIKGDAASSVQFTLTDSTNHFVRGALYFNNIPNKDSLAPVVKFIKDDVIRLMESFEWTNVK